MSTFEGKVIAVTGAASGIGLATAHLLASRGAKLSICDNREDALQSAVEAIQKASPSTDVLSRTVDVSKRDEVEAWLGATVEQFGKLHGAVNAAGIIADYPGKPVQEISDESWQKTLDVNLTGVFICMRDQLRRLEHGGSIVNISSVYGLMAAATAGAYAATKVKSCRLAPI
jgi:NAD(P)-dependent dehydrogenase (short-subunit alcohol dehydrogenase family)